MHGRYLSVLQKEEINQPMLALWQKDGYMYPETESFIMVMQDEVIGRRNNQKYIVKDESVENDM